MLKKEPPSSRRKSGSSASDSEHKSLCRADARRWIPTFVGMTKWDSWARIVLLLIAALIVLTFRDYGITWDEELQSQYGLAVVDYYLSFFHDHRYADIFNLYLYGGMFDGFASIFDRFTPFSLYETRHLLNALMGLLALWGTWRLGRFVGGGAVGLMALVMLALTPMFYGHMFNNPKDIPFTAGIVWSLYYMGRCFAQFPAVPRRLIIKLGIIFGLTLGVRVGGVMLLAFWGGVLGVGLLKVLLQQARWGSPPHKGEGTVGHFLQLLRLTIPVTLIAYAFMLLCWPWAQQHPVMNPLRALSEFSNFPQDVEVLLAGTTYRSTQLPWYYVPLYFGVQLPEFLLVLLAASLVVLPRVWKSLNGPRQQTLITMLLMAGFPIVYAMLRHPALYDAVRHFMFAVPVACILAALTAEQGAVWAVGAFERVASRRVIGAGLGLLALIVGATQIALMARLHPYEYIYVNRSVGGVTGAYGQYELDYWGTSFKEAAGQLQDYVAREGGVPAGKIYKIAICGPWSAAMIYLPPDYEPVVADKEAQFFLSTTRWLCPKMRPGREIIRIERMGAPLAVVKDLRGGYEMDNH